MHIIMRAKIERGRETLTLGNLRITGRVAVTVAVVPLFAVGLHGKVARVLEKATVPVSSDGLAWIGRTRCSLAAVLLLSFLGCWSGSHQQIQNAVTRNQYIQIILNTR